MPRESAKSIEESRKEAALLAWNITHEISFWLADEIRLGVLLVRLNRHISDFVTIIERNGWD